MPLPIGTDQRLERTPWVTIGIISVTTAHYFLPVFWLPALLHGDIFHLFGNMFYLWIFGSYVEDRVGRGKFLLFYILCELGSDFLATIVFNSEGIGASGAISGVMALYLARCHYSKVRTIVNVGLLFFLRLDINAKWLIGWWFVYDLLSAVFGYTEIENIGYWAHTGGFLTGLLIAYANNYYLTGQKEDLLREISPGATGRIKPEKIEAEIKKVIALDPYDPESHLLLARYYSNKEEMVEAARQEYMTAVNLLYRMKDIKGQTSRVYREFMDWYGASRLPVEEIYKYAGVAHDSGDTETATILLAPLLDREAIEGVAGGKALSMLNRVAAKNGNASMAERARFLFASSFPESSPLPVLHVPGKATTGFSTARARPRRLDQVENLLSAFRQWMEEQTSNPMFWIAWAIIFPIHLLLAMMVWGEGEAADINFLLSLFIPTIAALLAVDFYENSGNLADIVFGRYRKSQFQAERDFIRTAGFNKAVAAERDEKFDDAVRGFEEVLEVDPEHQQARYRLAGIYRRLNREADAIREYEKLMELLHEKAPYHLMARDALDEIRGVAPVSDRGKPLEFR